MHSLSSATFLKVSTIATFITVLLIASFAGTPTQADESEQATLAATGAATATPVDDGVYPPCPKVIGVPVQASPTPDPSATATMTPTITPTATQTTTPDPNIIPTPTLFLEPLTDKPGCTLTTELWGVNEAPDKGAPDGGGLATIIIRRPTNGPGEVCFKIEVAKITLPATGAHIHAGIPGQAGPIVVPLVPPAASGTSTGCIKNVDRNLIKQILTEPNKYYVNVHTSDFPAGALRGQLTVPVAYNR
jgi:hypothetical protein